ncbi:MAG: PilW family protein [Alishewanella agri]|nr:PilW family protein [Alishewanella agri]
MPSCHTPNQQRAFTLVELMIALTLSSLIILAVTQIYLSSAQTSRLDNEQAILNSKSLYALEVLERNIREAGFASCSPDFLIGNWVNGSGVTDLLLRGTGIYGYEHSDTAPGATFKLPGARSFVANPAAPVPVSSLSAGSDVLIIQHRNSQQVTIANTGGGSGGSSGAGAHAVCTSGVIQSGNALQINENISVPQNSLVFFEQACRGGDLFVKSNQSGNGQGQGNNTFTKGGNLNISTTGPNGFCNDYQNGASLTLSVLEQRAFYIAPGQDGEPALMMQTIDADNKAIQVEQIISGIEAMQITYGVNGAGSSRAAANYVTANAVTDWQQVVSVRVSLLLRSADNVLPQSGQQNWLVNATTLQVSTDRRSRLVLTATTAIRNKTL